MNMVQYARDERSEYMMVKYQVFEVCKSGTKAHVRLNDKLLEEVNRFKYLGLQGAANVVW